MPGGKGKGSLFLVKPQLCHNLYVMCSWDSENFNVDVEGGSGSVPCVAQPRSVTGSAPSELRTR